MTTILKTTETATANSPVFLSASICQSEGRPAPSLLVAVKRDTVKDGKKSRITVSRSVVAFSPAQAREFAANLVAIAAEYETMMAAKPKAQPKAPKAQPAPKLTACTPPVKTAETKRGPGRPKGSKNRPKAAPAPAAPDLGAIAAQLATLTAALAAVTAS